MRPVDRPKNCPTRDPRNDEVRQRLRDLPRQLEPPYTWAQFQLRSRTRHPIWREMRQPRVTREHALAAACVTALVTALALWGRADHSQHVGMQRSGATAQRAAATVSALEQASAMRGSTRVSVRATAPRDIPADDRAGSAASIAVQATVAAQLAMLTRPQASQRWLERQPAEPVVVRVGSRLAIANLEDRLAWMDDALTEARYSPANSAPIRQLQRERARLVNSLAQVRYAETLAAQMP